MNPVISTIKEHIADQNVRFVFPSQTAAALWARKTCTLGIVRSVAGNRFLAWDRFKEEVIRERDSRREPVSALIRKLFAEALVRKNAEIVSGAGGQGLSRKSGGFPLQSLIPQEYARGGSIFAPAIARFLPSLFMWEKLTKTVPGYRAESEDEDYQTIKNEYAIFLEHYKLFEPSWEEIKIRGGDRQYLIFFPELIEDFAEYDALLAEPQFIRIKAGEAPVPEGLFLLSYQSAREEIRSAVMELRRLHEEEGVPYEDMAVSVPELEEMEPCLLKEFSLRHIPVTRRAGKNLGESGAGRLFSLLNECAASQFSFNSLKALVLNDHIPWKERKKNKALINFGIRYNCVSCYAEQGKVKDIWEEAFREAYNDGGRELRQYYRDLKKAVMSITGAETFADIRKYYFTFRGRLLDMEKISPEDDAVLSRCVEELGAIIDLEEKFSDPALVPSAPFGFFVSCLGEKEYVLAGQQPGVNIFKWRVAAASPFGCHFVLNASQSAAAILYQPMQFLRQDKRKALGLEDRDATGAFFLLCDTGEEKDYKCHCRISAAAQTFSGWAIPHSFFAQGKTADSQSSKQQGEGEDPYREERRFWREAGNPEGTPEGHTRDGYTPGSRAGGLQRIFPLQKKSFEIWKEALTQKKNNFSFFGSPVTGAGADSVRQLLEDAVMGKDGCLTVTPTRDLNVYYRCPVFWLYSRIFGLEEFSLEAALLDDTSLGLLYHAILENLFARIRDEDGVFDSRRLGTYKKWALEITRSAIREHPAFRGPLAVPLVSPQAAGMSKKIAELLELEAQYFGGYRVAELELPVSYPGGKLLVKGVIDRVSVSPDGEPVIMDYKTNYLPDQTSLEDLEEAGLLEFQMPLYIKLYEERLAGNTPEASDMNMPDDANTPKVQGAFFYSINKRMIKAVMGQSSGGRNKGPDRDEYEPFLAAAEKQIEEFAQRVTALDFVPLDLRVGDCLGCMYKTACRSAYFINSGAAFREEEA